ncbi:MAG: succinate--CoA ligase subunit alpha [Elusimicrobia bacterium]|nr:succinate--CoA ligase subunit alpha [Elusimicrobiota bacterium]
MSILIDKDSRIVVQGITGAAGSFHALQCREYGTQVVAGVTPGKGGETMQGIPVFNTVEESARNAGANVSLIFVPPSFAADAILEAADSGIRLIVCITEGIPVLDMARVHKYLRSYTAAGNRVRLIGPNCPGVITPGQCKAGIMPGYIHQPGPLGVVSRSGTLTYEAVWQLSRRGVGQSTVVGIGGDPLPGSNFSDILELFEEDPETRAVILIGEIGGSAEEEAARFVRESMDKPVYAFVAGGTAPPGRRMGHAGAIIEGNAGTHASKVQALRAAGVTVVDNLSMLGETVVSTERNLVAGPARLSKITSG